MRQVLKDAKKAAFVVIIMMVMAHLLGGGLAVAFGGSSLLSVAKSLLINTPIWASVAFAIVMFGGALETRARTVRPR